MEPIRTLRQAQRELSIRLAAQRPLVWRTQLLPRCVVGGLATSVLLLGAASLPTTDAARINIESVVWSLSLLSFLVSATFLIGQTRRGRPSGPGLVELRFAYCLLVGTAATLLPAAAFLVGYAFRLKDTEWFGNYSTTPLENLHGWLWRSNSFWTFAAWVLAAVLFIAIVGVGLTFVVLWWSTRRRQLSWNCRRTPRVSAALRSAWRKWDDAAASRYPTFWSSRVLPALPVLSVLVVAIVLAVPRADVGLLHWQILAGIASAAVIPAPFFLGRPPETVEPVRTLRTELILFSIYLAISFIAGLVLLTYVDPLPAPAPATFLTLGLAAIAAAIAHLRRDLGWRTLWGLIGAFSLTILAMLVFSGFQTAQNFTRVAGFGVLLLPLMCPILASRRAVQSRRANWESLAWGACVLSAPGSGIAVIWVWNPQTFQNPTIGTAALAAAFAIGFTVFAVLLTRRQRRRIAWSLR